jgi:hypothetical protein
MTVPLFKVGEEVILKSILYPELNGEYTVEIVNAHSFWVCRETGTICNDYKGDTISYQLDVPVYSEDGVEGTWAESALRKKHKPSGMSLDCLLSSLNEELVT